jgi:rod shape-determining protein MreC
MLENIPNHVEVDSGQLVVTRGGGGVFPPGIIIGAAESSQKDESSGFQEIKVRLASDFRKVSSLYIIQNLHKTEYDSLMQSTTQWID